MDSNNPSGDDPSITAAALGLVRALSASGVSDCKVTVTFDTSPDASEKATVTVQPLLPPVNDDNPKELGDDERPEQSGLLGAFVLFALEDEGASE